MKKKLLFLWLMLLTMGISGFSQETTITIGTGTTTDYTFPFNNYYRNSWNEMIYPASLITEAGNIVSIAFHVSAVPSSDYPFSTLTIYMGTTADEVHSSTTSWLPMSDLTEVYSATNVSSPTDTGWMTINLDSPFLYDGTGNLVIVTSKTMANYTSALKFYYTAGPSGCSMYRRHDTDASYANHPGTNAGTNSTYRPNLQLTFTPMSGDYCYAVKNLAVTNVTASDATINWQSSPSAVSYIVQYKTLSEDWENDAVTLISTDTIIDLTNLSTTTSYDVRVAAYCGSDTSSWKSTSFSTTMIAVDLPYATDFGTDADQAWELNNGSCTNYWAMGAVSDTNNALFITTDGTTPGYTITSASVVSASKLFTVGEDAQFQISFDVMIGGESSLDYLKLFFAPPTETYPASSSAPTSSDYGYNSYSTYAFDFSDYMSASTSSSNIAYKFNLTGGNVVHIDAIMSNPNPNPDASSTALLVFVWRNDSSVGTQPGAIISNLTVSVVTCPSPENLTATNITPSSADIAWVDNVSSSWTVEYGEHGFTLGEGTEVIVSGSPEVTFWDLDPNTKYDVYVSSLCDNGEVSVRKFLSFKTECVAISVSAFPYYEQFEGYATYSFPDCWTRIAGYSTSTYDYPYIGNTSSSAHSGSGYLYLYNNAANPIVMALPSFVEDLNTLRLSFWMKPAGTSNLYGRVDLGVMTDLTDTTTFTLLDSWSAVEIGSSTWAYYEMDLDTMVTDETGYLVFRRFVESTTTYTWYFDDVKVMVIPTCEAPTELSFAGATTNSVTLSWNPGEESNFTVYYKALADEEYTAVTGVYLDADSTYILGNLAPSTNYSIYVASVCSDGSETPCDPIICATTMPPVALPYTTDFGSDSDQDWLLNNGSCTNYWTMGAVSDTMENALYITTDGTTPGYSVSNISVVSASKLFTIGDAAQFQVSFDVKVGGESSFDYIKLFFAPETEQYPASTTAPTSSNYGYNSYSTYAFDFSDYMSLSTSTSSIAYKFNLTGGNVVHVDAIFSNPHENPDANSTAQLVFAWKNDGSGGTQPGAIISNLSVSVVSCPAPENVMVTNLNSHSADVVWEDNTASSWTVEYGEHGFILGNGTEIVVSGTPMASLANLDGQTAYDVYVKANCGDGDVSINAFTTFTTPCEPLTTLPFTENFDSIAGSTSGTTNNLPDCWSNFCNSTSSSYIGYPIVYNSSTYAASGSNSLRFYTYTSGSTTYGDQIAILPLFDPTLYPVNTLQLSFDARSYSTYTLTLVVGVMSNPTDITTFEAIDTIVSTSTTYANYEIPLSQYAGMGGFIALMAPQPASSYNSGYVDNIVVDLIPSCPKPIHFQVAGLTTNSVDLTWTETGTATAWEIEYGPVGFTPGGTAGTVENVTNEPPYTVSGLSGSTSYDFYLRADCGNEYSAYSPVLTVTTACDAITTLPFEDGFDTYGTGTTTYPTCWGRINTYTSGDRPYVSTTHYEGVGSLYFYAGSGSYNIAITPVFDESIPVNTLQATFMYRATSSTDRLIVGVMTNPTDANSFVPVDTVYPASSVSAWEEREVIFSQYEGEGQYIAFKNEYTTAVAYGYMDNLVINLISTCPKPTDVHVVNATTSSIELDWTENGTATTWEVAYGAPGFDPDSTFDVVTAYSMPFEVQNLDNSTLYQFYVRAICDGSDVSYWSASIQASTACDLISLPYSENFDAYTATVTSSTPPSSYPNDIMPLCWTFLNRSTSSSTYPSAFLTAYSNYAVSGNCLFFKSSSSTPLYAVLPELNADLNTLQITFTYRNEGTTTSNGILSLGYMTSNMDASTFVELASYPQTTTLTEVTALLDSVQISTGFLAFKYTGGSANNYYLSLDNIYVEVIPTCPRPTDLTVTDNSATSVTLSWTENGSATSWAIAYGAPGFDPDDATATIVTANTNPFEVQNLTSSSQYQFYVRAICSGSDQSNWSNPCSGMTECGGPVALPYTETFEGYPGSTYNTPGIAPVCWTTYSNNATYGAPHITSSGSYHYVHSGTNCMVFTCSSAGSDAYAALPEFNASLNTLTLNFWRAMESTSNGTLTVGYVTDLDDLATSFVTVATIPSVSSSAGDTISVDFTDASIPATGNICFHWQQSSTYYSCCIDDIEVTSNGSGPVITNPTVATTAATAIAQTTATLNATITNPDNVTITAKGFEWKTTTGGTYTQIAGTGTGNTFTANLSGLTENTQYTYKAFITYNGTTVYGNEMNFTTLSQGQLVDPTVATEAATAIAQTTATLNATITNPDNVSVTAKGFEWKATSGGTYTQIAGTGTGNTFTADLSGLTANTDYTYKAFITFNGNTVYGSEMSFTTEAPIPCDEPTGLTVGDVTSESIVITWDANDNAESYNIQYCPQGGTISSANTTTNSYTITGLTPFTTYQIQVQANCGDGNLSGWTASISVTTTGIDNYLSNSIALYPNPANDVINVQCTMNNVQGVEVIDVYGKVINTINVTDNPTRINVSGLASGMYFVRVTTEEGTVTKTFVKK